VDLSPDAVSYAEARYASSDVSFAQGDALEFHDAEGFDTIVSLETVEHVSDPQRLIANLAGILRPGGVLVASVPTTPSVDVNPHHRHDFTGRSFRTMFREHPLRERAHLLQVQRVPALAVLQRSEERLSDRRPQLLRYYSRHPQAFARRAWATLRYGFTNRYLTIAWQREA
jgi:SAM-dependent methyltransferase